MNRAVFAILLPWAMSPGCAAPQADDMVYQPVAAATAAPGSAAEPPAAGGTLVWLDYADGSTPAPADSMYAGLVPPAAGCGDARRAELRTGLRARFGDLAIDFVEAEPAGPHMTVVLSSGGDSWTPDGYPGRGGISPFTCGVYLGTSFVFRAGDSDEDTAAIMVAHEVGHLFGLEHTLDNGQYATLMAPVASARGESFGLAATVDDRCGRATQDEPEILVAALGYRKVMP